MSRQIYSVKNLVGELKTLLEGEYPEIWVEGEVANLATPASGHRYFSLREEGAVIRCALFSRTRVQCAEPAEGMQALVRGRVSVYAPRGDMQFIVSWLEHAGEGALRREFERLKRKLSAEGLFDDAGKKTLPTRPKVIGVISSASGAALHDVRVTLQRRYPLARLVLYPALVQGAEAAADLVAALDIANRRREADVLILTRGGGSLEDLQAFNDERVARGIFASQLPVVSAVGHEIDFTIADFVADLRAATPTAAAEAVSPELAQLREAVRRNHDALGKLMRGRMETLAQTLDHTAARLVHPLQRIEHARRQLHALANQLRHRMDTGLDHRRLHLRQRIAELRGQSPGAQLAQQRQTLAAAHHQLRAAATTAVTTATRRTDHLTAQLNLMSPSRTLQRGYAIIRDRDNKVIFDAAQTTGGQHLSARVARGGFECVVERVDEVEE